MCLHQSQLVAIQEFLFSSKGRSFCVPHDTLLKATHVLHVCLEARVFFLRGNSFFSLLAFSTLAWW